MQSHSFCPTDNEGLISPPIVSKFSLGRHLSRSVLMGVRPQARYVRRARKGDETFHVYSLLKRLLVF